MKNLIRYSIIISILFFTMLLLTCSSQEEGIVNEELQNYVENIFNRTDKKTYICDIPIILSLNGDCGFIQVPVDYTNLNKDTYFIFWFFLPAENKTNTTKTIVPLIGRAGISTTSFTGLFIKNSYLMSLRRQHNILGFDYRGLGLSEPYSVHAIDYCSMNTAPKNSLDYIRIDFMKQCQSILQKYDIQYSNISTANFVKDLERILAYHDIDDAILYGISYGTRVALTAARDISHRIAGIVLDGVLPIEINSFEQALEPPLFNLSYLIQNFNENKNSLPSDFGDIKQRITQVASDAIKKNKQNIVEALEVLIEISRYAYDEHRFLIAHTLLSLYEKKDTQALLSILTDLAIIRYSRGDHNPPYFDNPRYTILDEKSEGLFYYRPFNIYVSLSIMISEEYNAPFNSNVSKIENIPSPVFALFETLKNTNLITNESESKLTYQTAAKLKNILQFEQARAIEFKPVISDIPTLLFSGRQNMKSSSQWANIVSDNMYNSKHFIFTNEWNAVTFSNDCALLLFEHFVKNPQAVATLDGTCVEEANSKSLSIRDYIE